MSLSTQPYKGTRDFYPEDMRVRKWMFAKWRKVVESFGYEEYDGPILEPLELYTAKTSEEIVNDQSFNFEDRGGRKVVMRPEMTPTVSRMVAGKRQELGYPLRLYSIPNCFRYERQQRGRLREFWQLNVDLFGVEGVEADIEAVALADAIMKEFKSGDWHKDAYSELYEIRYSSRKLINEFNDSIDLELEKRKKSLQLVDKKEKISEEAFKDGLSEIYDNLSLKAFEFFSSSNLDKVSELIGNSETIERLRSFEGKLNSLGIKIIFDAGVTRGFDYYTDIVFEVFDFNDDNNRSMFGGGRYDGLVGEFGVEPVPTVGFGMGDVTFQNFLESNKLLPQLPSETDVYIVVIGDVLADAQKVAQQLREKGVNVTIDLSGNKTDKQIKNALKKNIPYLLFIGEEEVKNQIYTLKETTTSNEQKLNLERITQVFTT